jgi:hypothetical protein
MLLKQVKERFILVLMWLEGGANCRCLEKVKVFWSLSCAGGVGNRALGFR